MSNNKNNVNPQDACDLQSDLVPGPCSGGDVDVAVRSESWNRQGGPAKQLTFGHVFRFKFMILMCFLIVAVPSIGLIWVFTEPKYDVSGQIRVRPKIPRLVFKTDDNGPIQYYNSYLNTQVAIIIGPVVLERVLDLPEIQQTDWYRKNEFVLIGPPPSPMQRLFKGLVVEPRAMTEVIDVTLSDKNAREAALIVNAVLDQYTLFLRESLGQSDDLIYQKLMEEYTQLRQEIESREKMAARLRKELGTGTPQELVLQRRVRLDEMQSELDVINRAILTSEWQLKELALLKKNSSSENADQQVDFTYQNDSEWQRLYLDWRMLKYQVEVDSDKLGEGHPQMVELKKKIKLANELVRDRELYLDSESPFREELRLASQNVGTGIIQDEKVLTQQIKKLRYEKQLLVKALADEQAGFEHVFDASQLLASENELIGYKRDVYQKVRRRINEMEMERNVPGSIEILARAKPATDQPTDRRVFSSIIAMFGGLALGFGMAFFRASTTEKIYEVDDLHCSLRTPVLGHVPYCRRLAAGQEADKERVDEYIRMIRTTLLNRLGENRGSAILLTSAFSGAGKTTVSIMLAKSLTHCGKKVLLVDSDVRKSSFADYFGIDSNPGLRGVLALQRDDSDAILKINNHGLFVLPAGDNWDGDEQELLAGDKLSQCLDRWRKTYDVILFDGAPIMPVADSRILCRYMDGIILVIQRDHCKRSDVLDSLSYIDSVGGQLVGTVFVASEIRSTGYNYSNVAVSKLPEFV